MRIGIATDHGGTDARLNQLAINSIRTVSIDAVQQAKSGHPGTPMALAPLVYTIWNRALRFDPIDPIWRNRDRFVLSNGHASMLLWSVLHLTGTRTANRRGRRKSVCARNPTAGPRTRNSSCPKVCANILTRESACAARKHGGGWTDLLAAYRQQFPQLATEIDQIRRRELPVGWDRNLPVFPADPKGLATRESSGKVLNVLAQNIPWFLGGSADLGPSNKTLLTFDGAGDFQAATPSGKNLHFGIREHAMSAIVNGLSLSKLRAFGATFLACP